MVDVGRIVFAATVAATMAATACGTRTSASISNAATGTSTTAIQTPTATPSLSDPSATAPAVIVPSPSDRYGPDGVPHFDHIVVVIEENKPYSELVDTSATPFLTAVAHSGAVLTQSYAITHPSEPNYLALFSGSTQGLNSDSCPHRFTGPNLAASLIAQGDTFTGYAESLPSPGYQGCSAGEYARKHAPWANFSLPTAVNQPMTAFPADFARLPTVSFVVPNLQDDMHDGTIAHGDQWLAAHLSAYRTWAGTHNSLLVITTDEDDSSHGNHIATILAGAHVRPGTYATRTDHYGLLHTLLDSDSLAPFAAAATTPAITRIWSP